MADKNGDLKNYKHRVDDNSLINCLEYCTNYFNSREDDSALRLWYLIGTQGPGILLDDIKEIITAGKSVEDDTFRKEESKTPDGDPLNVFFEKIEKDLNDLI